MNREVPPSRNAPGGAAFLVFLSAFYVYTVVSQPLPTQDWSYGLLGLAALALIRLWVHPRVRVMAPLTAIAGLLALYQGLLMLPLPAGLVSALSPERGVAIARLQHFLPVSFAPLAFDQAEAAGPLLGLLGCFLVFTLLNDAGEGSRGSVWLLMIPPVLAAGAEAGYGLVQRIWLRTDQQYLGTFPNRDFCSSLLEMALPVAVLMSAYGWRQTRKSGRLHWGLFVGVPLTPVLLLAIAWSYSRAGLVTAILALIALAAIGMPSRWPRMRRGLLVAGALAVAPFAVAFLAPEYLRERWVNTLEATTLTADARSGVWHETAQVIARFPVFGAGPGGLHTALLPFRHVEPRSDFAYGLSGPLQVQAELGIAGLLLGLAALAFLVSRLWRVAHAEELPARSRYLAMAGFGSLAAFVIHSLVDDLFYVPALTATIAWILGAACGPTPGGRSPRGWARCGFGVMAGVLGVCALAGSAAQAQANERNAWELCGFGFCDAEAIAAEERLLRKEGHAAETLERARFNLKRSAGNPLYWFDLADAEEATGDRRQAAALYDQGWAIAPNALPPQVRAATFFADHGEKQRAAQAFVAQLEMDPGTAPPLYAYLKRSGISTEEILSRESGLTPGGGGSLLRILLKTGDAEGARAVWRRLADHKSAPAPLAQEYIGSVWRTDPERASAEYARYLGETGYGTVDFLLNGGFEHEFERFPFDWQAAHPADVETRRDPEVRREGRYSYAVHFLGKENLEYRGLLQQAFLRPGRYALSAWVRSEGITSDSGPLLQLTGPELEARTGMALGTADWREVTVEATVRKEGVYTVAVARAASRKFDSRIQGTYWIDEVRLRRIGRE